MKHFPVSLFLIFLISCNQTATQNENTDSTTVVKPPPILERSEKINLSKDTFFYYRHKAFDTIEFGTHNDYRDNYYKLLTLDFKFGGQIDYYYGLYTFILKGIDNIQSHESAIDYLKDIADVIDKKHYSSQMINRKVSEGVSPLLLLDCKVLMTPDEFNPSSIPKDASTKYIYKRWTKKETIIEAGYTIDYSCKVDKEKSPKKISFERRYELYIEFESPYLRQMINKRNGTERNSDIEKESSKF